MKKKPLKRRWSSFFGQRSHGTDSRGSGNMPELIKSESDWPRVERLMEDLLRWADDGGKMLDLKKPTVRPDPETALEPNSKSESPQKKQRNQSVSENDEAPLDGS